MLVLGIALAGAVGAPARYLVDGVVLDRTECGLPAGTFVVNVSGSFLLGVLTGLALYHAFPSTPKTILGTGFCGAYTTFSTFEFETHALFDDGSWLTATTNLCASVFVGLVAVRAGIIAARTWLL